jgi:putative GTP pyrophosphokinase
MTSPTTAERKNIEILVQSYLGDQIYVNLFRKQILDAFGESKELQKLVHSTKSRLKDPEHLRDKLVRKLAKCKSDSVPFDIDPKNLFQKINDLAGIRLLHVHTKQIKAIDAEIKRILRDMRIEIVEGPFARTWDDESRSFFISVGIVTQPSDTMYTSVHYVVASKSKMMVTCEIQVRTLMEEVWGEVDHAINYPRKIDDVACSEQIRALARSTSSATRLVDSIFATVAELERKKVLPARKTKASKPVRRRRDRSSKARKPALRARRSGGR